VDAPAEELCRQAHRRAALNDVRIHAEVFKVAAIVADKESGLVLAWTEEIGTEARAASDHLPKLGLRADALEEGEIDHLGDVNAGVEHVNGDRQVRHLLWLGEVVDQRLSIVDLMSDDSRESPFQMRVVMIEAFRDELGMALVLGEQDRLTQAVSVSYLNAVLHQMREHKIDRVFVEEPLMHLRRFDDIGSFVLLTPLKLIPSVLVFVAQVVIAQALGGDTRGRIQHPIRHQVFICDRLRKRVLVRRDAVFKLKEAVGIVVDLVARRGGQADEQRVEVIEDRAIFLIDGAMRLVDDDEVEERLGSASRRSTDGRRRTLVWKWIKYGRWLSCRRRTCA